MDLYVWYEGEEIVQFQICYDKGMNERAITWRRAGGLSHHFVDDGEGGVFRMKGSPMLTGRAHFNLDHLRALFENAARKLEHDLYSFIMKRLEE